MAVCRYNIFILDEEKQKGLKYNGENGKFIQEFKVGIFASDFGIVQDNFVIPLHF